MWTESMFLSEREGLYIRVLGLQQHQQPQIAKSIQLEVTACQMPLHLHTSFDVPAACALQFSFDCNEQFPPQVRTLCPLIALSQERAVPISYYFSQEAVKSLLMGDLTGRAYCCHMSNNACCK